jgi:hypothetical protein
MEHISYLGGVGGGPGASDLWETIQELPVIGEKKPYYGVDNNVAGHTGYLS